MKKLVFLISIGIVFIMTSCSKAPNVGETPNTIVSTIPTTTTTVTMENLEVSSNFNWKTYKDISLTLTGSNNSIVEVVSPNGTVYQKAYLSKDKSFNLKLAVPTYETELKLKFDGQEKSVNIASGNVVYTFQ